MKLEMAKTVTNYLIRAALFLPFIFCVGMYAILEAIIYRMVQRLET